VAKVNKLNKKSGYKTTRVVNCLQNEKIVNFGGHYGLVVQWIEYQIPVLRVEGTSPSEITVIKPL
jgi:hypothetical protein